MGHCYLRGIKVETGLDPDSLLGSLNLSNMFGKQRCLLPMSYARNINADVLENSCRRWETIGKRWFHGEGDVPVAWRAASVRLVTHLPCLRNKSPQVTMEMGS